jgi:hypothetical protein
MGTHVSISGAEAADRLEIRELVDAYAHCADRRDAKGQMSLFTPDAHFVVFMDTRSDKPSMELKRREDLASVFHELNKYEATTHFMGQSTVVLDGERATGETYCIAHHVSAFEGNGLFLLLLFVIMMSLQKLRESGFLPKERLLLIGQTHAP